MDVSGHDMTWVPSKGKVPQRVRVKRSIGQEKNRKLIDIPAPSSVPSQHLRARSRQLCSASGSWLGCSCGSSGARGRGQEQH